MPTAPDRTEHSEASAGRQSRLMSLAEVTTNVAIGYMLALATQFAIFPMFGLAVSVADNLMIGGIFTAVSIGRGYALRRLFNTLRGH